MRPGRGRMARRPCCAASFPVLCCPLSLAPRGHGAQRFEFLLELIPIAGFDTDEMSFLAALQSRNTFAGRRSQHNDMRHPCRSPRPMQAVDNGTDVIAVDVAHLPAEGAPFFS